MKKLKPVIGRSGTPDVRSFGTHDYGCEERSDVAIYYLKP
jgi:hypothetical protein